MDISHIKEFIDLAQTLNFTKTARNMSVSQSALSRHIADLEREVGSELLERSTTSVSLTPAGRAFYERAEVIARDFDTLMGATAQAKEPQATPVRVAGNTMQPFTSKVLYRLAFRARREQCGFRPVFYKTRSLSNEPPVPPSTQMLTTGEVDLTIEVMPFNARPPRGFEGIRLAYEPLLAICSPQCPLASKSNLHIDDLRGYSPVAMAVYKSCPGMELAPFSAAGIDISHARTLFAQNMLEVPENLAILRDDEIAPLEQEFCELYGFSPKRAGDEAGFCVLDIQDDRFRFAYWALWRADEHRPAVLEAVKLLRTMVDEWHTVAASQDIHPDGTLWARALQQV